jgi:DnaJ-class molecular chaperone
MIQQMVAPCNECGGQGNIIPKKDRCQDCTGQKTKRISQEFVVCISRPWNAPLGPFFLFLHSFSYAQVTLAMLLSHQLIAQTPDCAQVHIDPGMRDGDRVTFNGEGDQTPGVEPGDVVVVLREKTHEVCPPSARLMGFLFFPLGLVLASETSKHEQFAVAPQVFSRSGMDLMTEMGITLAEALCGFQRPVKHLDGRTLLVTVLPGEVIKDGAVKSIPGEGMPKPRHPELKGMG